MIKSSVLKKVISGVLVLTTVCIFSAGACFAKGDDPDNVKSYEDTIQEDRDNMSPQPAQRYQIESDLGDCECSYLDIRDPWDTFENDVQDRRDQTNDVYSCGFQLFLKQFFGGLPMDMMSCGVPQKIGLDLSDDDASSDGSGSPDGDGASSDFVFSLI